jgi:DNA mismatch repair protein MutS2
LYQLLEFDKILAQLKQLAISAMASERFDELQIICDRAAIERALTETTELRAILDHDSLFPLQQLWDTRDDLQSAAIEGNYLKPEALLRVAENLRASWQVRSFLHHRRASYPNLWRRAETITNFKHLEAEIHAKIDPQSRAVRDSASPKLNQIRKEIARHAEQVRRILESQFKAYSQRGFLQDDVVTFREGRLVLPVKIENRERVKGLVHGHSASGATLFIEPFEAVEINNDIHRLRGEEALEIERILRALTAAIRAELPGIQQNLAALVHLDFVQAKGRFAKMLKCSQPALSDTPPAPAGAGRRAGDPLRGNDQNLIDIAQGRHPLLLLRKGEDAVVPLDLKMGGEVKTLVITGPNAGGKTVALKTVGLFAVMTQCGIPIPAHPDSRMPIFNEIFADIGDFQSLEQDLSTFSSHLQKLQTILERADQRSLVLVDEIGVGTDPQEGSALAVAVLEELTRRGGITIVTTHHGALKEFAFSTPGVENGSMEFDQQTLRPVYRLRMGVPGSSYALEIAKRLGVAQTVLNRARESMGAEKGNVERLIMDLEQKAQEAQKLADTLRLEKNRLEGLTKLYKERYDTIHKQEKQLKEKALAEAQEILRRANAAVEKAIKDIRENQAAHEAIRRAKEMLAEENARVKNSLDKLTEEQPEPDQATEIKIGDEVLWKKQKTVGVVVSESDENGRVLIQVNQLKFWVPLAELAPAPKSSAEKKTASAVSVQAEAKSDVLPEINLLGNKLDEAIAKVDKFLDDALLAGWSQVRIIHGKGTGALRKGIAEFLDQHPRVKSKKMAAWNEGDLGVTVVELD